jgi:1,4-alpha-glucan branching enzyme
MFMGTEGHMDGFWSPSSADGDHRMDWLAIGDDLGAPMQRMVRDVNNVRWNHHALRSPGGAVVHVDRQNQVVGFKRFDNGGDVLLVVVNAGDSAWTAWDYGVSLAGDGGAWREIFNSQAPDYGGINAMGNFGATIGSSNGSLFINLPSWSVLIFQKQ